jgi:hypothetical protein
MLICPWAKINKNIFVITHFLKKDSILPNLQYFEYTFPFTEIIFLNYICLICSGKLATQFDELEDQLMNGTLLIHDVKEEDEGYYMCEANNGIGTSLSAVVFLTVNGECSLLFMTSRN